MVLSTTRSNSIYDNGTSRHILVIGIADFNHLDNWFYRVVEEII